VKNGIYGEMFCAAMIAAALVLNDPAEIMQAGLDQIPRRSRLADAVRRTIDRCESLGFAAERFEEAQDWLWREFGGYHPIHTINNAAAVVLAVLLGGGDFGRTIAIAVTCGSDTDCNGATAGCLAGAMLGAARLPAQWTAPLNDTLYSGVAGYHPIAISQCAARHAAIARHL
jgi:ADP-ribosylglycohydrolase